MIVIGAGVGGLTAGALLAAQGCEVQILERAAMPGGKLRTTIAEIDAGPTVFTMRWVFEEIFAALGMNLPDALPLRPVERIARHAWGAAQRLDLFADIDRSADAIGAFAGAAEAAGYRAFCARARGIYQTLESSFIRAAKPTPLSLVRSAGLRGLPDLWQISPFQTLWGALGDHFKDARLRQLFGRYSTYCGASPFAAPATLMLIAHVEQDGVWLVEGGMIRIAQALAGAAVRHGATLRTACNVREIISRSGRATGVILASGERLEADAIVFNGDAAALAGGLLGRGAASAAPDTRPEQRSLSAVTWSLVARTEGFPLIRHSVFFSSDYQSEFDDLFRRRRLPAGPTVYVCAQDRDDTDRPIDRPERLFCLINAPATGDISHPSQADLERCQNQAFALLRTCGLRIDVTASERTAPQDFHRLFPATGGALYGPAVHGSMASFKRAGARSRLPGLYLAGGSVHPGAGVPMAALSGRMAASALLADARAVGSASTRRSRPTAIAGGTSMR